MEARLPMRRGIDGDSRNLPSARPARWCSERTRRQRSGAVRSPRLPGRAMRDFARRRHRRTRLRHQRGDRDRGRSADPRPQPRRVPGVGPTEGEGWSAPPHRVAKECPPFVAFSWCSCCSSTSWAGSVVFKKTVHSPSPCHQADDIVS